MRLHFKGNVSLKRTEAEDFLLPSFFKIPGEAVVVVGLSSYNITGERMGRYPLVGTLVAIGGYPAFV
jgi:hypothetical protein